MVRLNSHAVRPLKVPSPSSGAWPVLDDSGVTTMMITTITMTPADDEQAMAGLIAFIAIEIDNLVRIDSLTLHRINRRLSVAFPKRASRRGAKHAIVRPIDNAARSRIERTILVALGVIGEGGSDATR